VTFLPRRVISLVLMVCFAGTPSLLLACAVICVPGTMTHGLAAAAKEAASASEASAHEHMHHSTAAGQSASVRTASPQPAPSVTAANLATSADVVGRGCCTHTSTSATTATTTTRADVTALGAPAALAVFIAVPAGRDMGQARATLVGRSFPPAPVRSPLVLRI
jgi:hypothetical protein